MNEKLYFSGPLDEVPVDSTPLYRQAFEHSLDCLAIYALGEDQRLHAIEVNAAFERLFDKPRHRVLGRYLEDLLPEGISNRIEEKSRICLTTGASLTIEHQVELFLAPRHLLHRLVPILDGDGHVPRLLHIVRDISASKRYEEKLLSDTQAFRALAEHTPDGIARYDRNCVRVYANPAFMRMTGVPLTCLLGKKPGHASSTPEWLGYEATLQEVLRSGIPDEYELTWPAAGGRLITSHIHVVPERNGSGEVCSVLAVGRDITKLRRTEEELRLKEQEFRTVVENSPDVIVRYDNQGRRIYINPAYERLYGVSRSEVLGTSIVEKSVLPLDLATHYHHSVMTILRNAQPAVMEPLWVKGNSEQIIQDIRGVPEFDQNGQVTSVLTIARDISALKITEQHLEEAEVLARLGHLRLDFRLGTLRLSAELCRMIGKPQSWTPYSEEVLALLTREDRRRIIRSILRAFAHRIEELQLDYCIQVGQERLHLHSRLRIEFTDDGMPLQILGTAQDISEIKAYQQQLHRMAFYDALTGLPNRALFNDRLQQATTQAGRYNLQVAVAVIDLDNFKLINDTLGHSAGDELLQEAAARLKRIVRSSDTVARLGGDEFALILSQISIASSMRTLGTKLLQAISGIYYIQGREFLITGSIGIARYPGDTSTISELLQYADSAMYHAKEQGRNNTQFYDPHLTEKTTERLALAASLRHAQCKGELMLHFQPKVELGSGQLIGAETLLRWNHPEKGLIPPDKFIPIAEETGLIVEIGEWVLRNACHYAVAWNQSSAQTLKIAVNLSPRQFKMNDLVSSIRTILQESHCEPSWLELEITEGLLLDNSIAVRETLEQLRAMGLSIAIDDFGTGYSALGYLNRFPVETLKIDRSFISDINHNRESAELVKAIISLAHALRLEVVAEGVEDSCQEAFLQRYGCQSAQGYLYGKAMSPEEFEQHQLRSGLNKFSVIG